MAEFNQYLVELLRSSPALGVAVMMNNYFHDVATAMLAASGFVLHAMVRVQAMQNDPQSALFFLKVHRMTTRFFKFALWWIIIGGVPRTIFFRAFEWNHFADQMQVPALIVKHILMAVLVIWGIYAWRRMQQKVSTLRQSLPAEMRVQVETS